MKNFIKKIIGIRISRYMIYQINKLSIPFSSQSLFKPENIYSDFFICDTKIFKNIFVAENTYALLESRNIKVEHNSYFYSKEGIFIEKKKYISDQYFLNIELPSFKINEKYISFTHEIKILNDRKNDKNLSSHLQHRGYSKYFKNERSIGTLVHGNFGAISPSNPRKSAAILRSKKYIYTPVYKFESKNTYHLVFNNPTFKQLFLNIVNNDNSLESSIHLNIKINPFGTDYIVIDNYSGKLSFISRLPICRCLVFKNPSPDMNEDFDVFHS